MSDINKELQDLIQKHAPGMFAGEMKSFIEKAQIAIEDNARLTRENNDYVRRIEQYKKDESEVKLFAKELEHKEANLKAAEEKLKEDSINQKVFELECKLSAEKSITTNNKEFMLMLVKNPRAIEYMNNSHHESIPLIDQYGSTRYEFKNSNSNGTKETIELKDDN